MSNFLECCYLVLLFALIVLGAPTYPNSTAQLVQTPYRNSTIRISLAAEGRFSWASVGDSWASGVSFDGNNTDYDADKGGCHRWKDSYGPLLQADTTWTESPQEFFFVACSGALLRNIVKYSQGENKPQMDLVTAPVQMVTYHAGGNNADFGATMKTCIYPSPQVGWKGITYLPEYPESGPCTDRITASNAYIDNRKSGESGLYYDETETIKDLLGHPMVRDNKDFKLYILGYAHFFNLDDNYCSDLSFAPLASIGGSPPKLSVVLRNAINDAVERVNNVLRAVINDLGDSRVKFIDLSPAFNAHRFCEAAHDKTNDQWYNEEVWLWNLNLPSNDPPADPKLMDQWLHGGASEYFQGHPEVEILGGGAGTWTERPFHPKKGGTEAIRISLFNRQGQIVSQVSSNFRNLPLLKGRQVFALATKAAAHLSRRRAVLIAAASYLQQSRDWTLKLSDLGYVFDT